MPLLISLTEYMADLVIECSGIVPIRAGVW